MEMYYSGVFPYKHVIIDEGQDFGQNRIEESSVIQTLESIVLSDEIKGTFYLFYDKNQLVQGRQIPQYIADSDCKLTLYKNCRNTENIAITSMRPLGKDKKPKMFQGCVKGASPDIHIASSEADSLEYIALTNLIPEFLQMVDEGKMALTPAVEISRLPIEAQRMLHRECDLCDCTPSYSQTVRMRKINEVRELTWHDLAEIMSEEKANQKEKVTLFMDDLKKYYPRSATPKDIAADIMKMLESRYKARRNRDAR